MWPVLRCVLYSPYSPVYILYSRRLYYSAIKTVFIYKIMGALDDLAFAMKVLIEVPAYRVAIRHGYLAVVFLLSYYFFIKTHTKKKDTLRCPFFNQILSH